MGSLIGPYYNNERDWISLFDFCIEGVDGIEVHGEDTCLWWSAWGCRPFLEVNKYWTRGGFNY